MLATQTAPTSRSRRISGQLISAFAILFLAFDGVIKVLNLAPAVESTTQLGYPAHLVLWIGVLELVCLVIYSIPRTSVFGAILLTGYLGGAIATHVLAASPLFSLVFPVVIGALVWGGLFLRDGQRRTCMLQAAGAVPATQDMAGSSTDA